MRFPRFMRPQRRESVTDRLIAQSVSAAMGAPQPAPADSAGAAVAAALYAGALGNANIKAQVDFQPDFLSSLARALVLRGEALYAIESDRSLIPCETWDISGGAAESTWSYRIDIATPDGNKSMRRPREGVCHFKWAIDSRKPWKGISPLDMAKGMSSLAAKSAQSLSTEYNATQMYVLPLMYDANVMGSDASAGDADIAEQFDKVKAGANGRTFSLLFTNQMKWPKDERDKTFEQKRLGASLTQDNVIATFKSQESVLSLCGIPPGLLAPEGQSRDAFRLWIATAVEPLAKRISYELSKGLETQVEIDTSPVTKQDIVGRARAFGSLVKGGMEVSEAAKISGVLAEDNE